MGGYGDNEAVTNHIWDVLVPDNSNVQKVIPTSHEQPTPPRLYEDWLSVEENIL